MAKKEKKQRELRKMIVEITMDWLKDINEDDLTDAIFTGAEEMEIEADMISSESREFDDKTLQEIDRMWAAVYPGRPSKELFGRPPLSLCHLIPSLAELRPDHPRPDDAMHREKPTTLFTFRPDYPAA